MTRLPWLASAPPAGVARPRAAETPVVSPFPTDAYVAAPALPPPTSAPLANASAPSVSGWRRALLASLTAVAAAGALMGTPVAAAPLASGSTMLPIAQTEGQRAQALVDRMLDRGRPGVDSTTREAVRGQLRGVPLDVLTVLDRSQVRIVVLHDGESLLDLRALPTVDVEQAYGDGRQLASAVDSVRAAVEAKYGPQIRSLEQQVAASPPNGGQRETLQMQLDIARSDRSEALYQGVFEATDGRVDQQDGMSASAEALGIDAAGPLSLADVARVHGARSAAEIDRFVGLMRALNGDDRLAAAQRKYAGESGGSAGDVVNSPMRLWRENIVVPAYDLVSRAGATVALSSTDATSLARWKAGQVEGQYFYEGRGNTLVVHAGSLGPNDRVLVHELGHAYEDAVSEQAPQRFAEWRAKRDADFARVRDLGGAGFPSRYASRSASEMSAETFADRFDGRPHPKGTDAGWNRTYDEFLEFAPRLAAMPAASPRQGDHGGHQQF